jgi:hypothetical protein
MEPIKSDDPVDIHAIMLDGKSIQRALRQSWISVLAHHKKMGYPVVVWSNGKVVEIPPEEIVIPELDPPSNDS